MHMPSVMKHDFSKAPMISNPRSTFNRSHGYKSTFNAGYLIPFYVDEVIPGDTHHVNSTVLLRFATLLYPLMDNIHVDIQYFFCPMRLLMNNFERMMGYQPDPGSSTSFIFPTVTSANTTDFGEGTLYDYFGIATKKANVAINSMPLRAYNKIWNDWYRDQNLQNSVIENVDDGPDAPSDFVLLRRGKRHDYFTSGLPTPQKGTAVELPLGTTAPVIGIGKANQIFQAGPTGPLAESTGATRAYDFYQGIAAANADQTWYAEGTATTGFPKIYADLSVATAATINDLRQAISVQRMYERDMRGGTRYPELLKSHYGITNYPDSRFQRPELLSVYSHMMKVSVVPNTAGGSRPQGDLAAFATGVCNNAGFIKSFVEHGYIIGLISCRADLTYQDGTDRMWFVSTRFDLYWPEFANLGEQAVLKREILTSGTAADLDVFSYQEAWAHLRYKNSKITGLFKTNATGTLDSWHLAQDLSGGVALNATFIVDNPPTTRVKATSGDPDFIMDVYHKVTSARPMPMYSIPGLTRL